MFYLCSYQSLPRVHTPTMPAAAKGCGCKGGPGWRGPDGTCVSKSALAETCGSPAGAPCKQESATRVCFGKQCALTAPKAKAQTQ